MTYLKNFTNIYVLFSTFKNQTTCPLFCPPVFHLESISFPVYGNVFGFANDSVCHLYTCLNVFNLEKNNH